MMVPTAQLKVFVPLASFPPRERERWTVYVEAGRGLTRDEVVDAEWRDATARLVGGCSRFGPDAALVRRAGRRTLICPLQLELRAAFALAAFRRTIPDALIGAFVPDAELRDDLAEAAVSGRAPHILDEPWAVPLHWFVAFAPDERRVHDPPEGRGPRVRYLTTVGQAVLRLEHAIEVVEATIEDGDEVLLALAELVAWLDAFDDEAVVELDEAGLAELRPADERREDRTCAELHEVIDALADGDLFTAAATFGAIRSRWSAQRARDHAS
ncbi:MAG: hypothetical protein WEB09_03645 [Nitriliruptor sp.]